jgi:hypothetical protein
MCAAAPALIVREVTPLSEPDHPAGQRAAGEYLRQLLLQPGAYRDSWREHVDRPRDGVVNQLAVAEVLAGHLRASRPVQAARTEPHELRNTVARALVGRPLSRQSLQLFIDAFGLTDDEAGRAWRLWSGATTIRVLAGRGAVPEQAEQAISDVLGPRRHRVLAMHDHVKVGATGLIESLHVIQTIEAIADSVDSIPVLADTTALTLEVGQGCRELSGETRPVAGGLFLTRVRLTRTLRLAETGALEYWVSWPAANPDNPSDREYRRAVIGKIAGYDARIEFHPEHLPATVWWATWDGIDGAVLERQAVTLDSQHSAHRYLQSVRKTVAGFYWR